MDVLNLEEGTSRKDPEKEFKLLEKLGEGSYGSVWKAMHIVSGGIVAIKKVPIDNDLEEIMKEIDFMKQCRSPFVVRYFGSYFKDSELWIVMEFCGAGSVCDLMKVTCKTLSEDQIAVISRDVLNGLAYLHSLRKIHRDIKAGNILLNLKGESKLADFGVSGQLSDTMAKRQTVIGTPFWMAPEVIQEVGYDVKADLWSFGITCIEMAESKPPWSNIHPMRAIFMIPSRPPPKLTEPEKWSKDFNDFVAKCLIKNPEQRPSALELLQHAFVKKAKQHAILAPLIDEQEQTISRIGRDSALGIEKHDEEEDEDSDGENAGGTIVQRPTKKKNNVDDNDDESSGTVVINDDEDYTGTMVVNDGTMVVNNDDFDDDGTGTIKKVSKAKPDFITHITKSQGTTTGTVVLNKNSSKNTSVPVKDGTVKQPTPAGNPKFASLSLEDLKKMVEDLDIEKEREIAEIKAKYALNKKSIVEAIEERQMK